MLSSLFGSNARVKILKLFLLNPHKKYYVRQLARDLKLQVNSVRRELDNLEKIGLLGFSVGKDSPDCDDNQDESGQAGKQDKKFFQVNPDFIIFEEIKALMLKSQGLHKDDFIDRLRKSGKIKLLILSGIFVNNKDSAVDLLIVGNLDKDKLMKQIRELEKELRKEINFTIMDVKEFMYRRDMTDVFLYSVLESRKMIAIDEIGLS